MSKRRNYTADDFITPNADPVEVAAAMKMEVLSGLHILKGVSDTNVQKLHSHLLTCKSEWEMQTMLHDLVRFNETVEEFLMRKES